MMSSRWRQAILAMSVAAAIAALSGTALARGFNDDDDDDDDWFAGNAIGNAIFIHPDGTALNQWHAARIFWVGPDGSLEYDKLPEIVVYRGHVSNRLTGTSNGGATTHAFDVSESPGRAPSSPQPSGD